MLLYLYCISHRSFLIDEFPTEGYVNPASDSPALGNCSEYLHGKSGSFLRASVAAEHTAGAQLRAFHYRGPVVLGIGYQES